MKPVHFLCLPAVLITGCEDPEAHFPSRWTDGSLPSSLPVSMRWYTPEQVEQGRPLFHLHCAECHGNGAEGAENWRQRGPDGNFPPPPLNGTGHAWHHPLPALRHTVRYGGAAVGGVMPPFDEKLSEPDVDAVLAWVQSHWSDEIYAHWTQRTGPPR